MILVTTAKKTIRTVPYLANCHQFSDAKIAGKIGKSQLKLPKSKVKIMQ